MTDICCRVYGCLQIFLHIQEREAAKHGLGTKPVGQVYYMPGASDAYVIAFRRWIQNVAGGGPFGPQNDAWLAQAGPRLPNSVLLDHYHSHVEKCASCSAALRRMKALSKAASVLAFLGAVAAVAAAAVLLAARFADGGSGAVALAGPMASSLQKILFGGGALAGVAGAVRAFCAATLPKFFKGEHPPPRNLVPGEWLPNKPQI